MSPIRLLIADDRAVTRSGLSALMRRGRDLEISGEARNIGETLIMCRELAPDVVLLNLRDLAESALPCFVESIRGTAVIVLRSAGSNVGLRAAIASNAAGFVDVDNLEHELSGLVGIVSRGYSICVVTGWGLRAGHAEPSPADTEISRRLDELTGREREVLKLMAEGYSNREISSALHVAESTVKKHATRLMRKLAVGTRVEAALLYGKLWSPEY